MNSSRTRDAVTALAEREAPMRARVRALLAVGAAAAAPTLLAPNAARAATAGTRTSGGTITVPAGETRVVTETTRVSALSIADGGTITAPDGYSLSLTVDGVETGQTLTETGGTTTKVSAGTYRGDVVLTVAEANVVTYNGLDFPIRQGLYVDGDGVERAKSVLTAVVGGRVTHAAAQNVSVTSTGEAFNGAYVKDATYTLNNPTFRLAGNGRSDFCGDGAAVVGTGATTLVVDGADISNKGVVRTAVISDAGANVIVKNSRIQCLDGVLPADYQATVETQYMESVPWMLGLAGNVRATNLIGKGSQSTYINSSVTSERWGAVSVEGGSGLKLAVVNSTVANKGECGYGTYAIGDVTEEILGAEFNVGTYATILAGPAPVVHYGDSTREAVAALNSSRNLGLSAAELAALQPRSTVINSRGFGFMFFGTGTLTLDGGTAVNTRRATFLNKGQQTAISVDGSQGARLNPGNGIILQVMELDDPGPVQVNGKMMNVGVYHEPTGTPAKDTAFDVTAVHEADAAAAFTDIALKGDFYNAKRIGKNMVLTFKDSRVEGVITASASKHAVDTITADDWAQLGIVTNAAQPAINNGVIVNLGAGSTWTVTGTSYLTKLVVDADAAVTAPNGKSATLTVDGNATALTPGTTYTGALVLTVG